MIFVNDRDFSLTMPSPMCVGGYRREREGGCENSATHGFKFVQFIQFNFNEKSWRGPNTYTDKKR